MQGLRTAEYEVAHVAELAHGIADEPVLALAREKESVLVAADKDFGELVLRP